MATEKTKYALIFCGSWKGGEKCGRKKLNKFRKVRVEGDD